MKIIHSSLVLVIIAGNLADTKSYNLYHDVPVLHHHDDDGHVFQQGNDRDHGHDQESLELYHDGPGGNPHDSDGHVHLQLQGRIDHEHEQGSIKLYHDGPGGHHHDDYRHLHHQAQEDVREINQDEGVKAEEENLKTESLRDITLTIAKLLFHMSQA